MISKTGAQQLLLITALLHVTFYGYVLLLFGHLIHRPSSSAQDLYPSRRIVHIGGAMVCASAAGKVEEGRGGSVKDDNMI
jgi:hypothetical protein